MGSTRECIEEFKINLLSKVHDEIREELNKMAQCWEDHASTWRQKMETWKTKMNTRDGRANDDTASQPAKIMEVVTDQQVPVESMELYDEINGAPIFDVYDEGKNYDVYHDVVPIFDTYDDEDLAVLGCSSFASSPRNNKVFKEPIDLSHDEALLAQFWICNVACWGQKRTRRS
ncbi:hypothetical protein DY000_02059986 [Brassica cretica]|uniref:Uncharacterized protein n=1 Tax=Brassica cretica TaxID=69181 RepID=A0ABQ7B0H2_BRACR|nr:hypothetical protein DY000_02059986 [Brassica cretica]